MRKRLQNSSDEKSDLESENEPAEKAQKAEIESKIDEHQEISANANPEQNVVPSTAVVFVYEAETLCSKILSTQSVIKDNHQTKKSWKKQITETFQSVI